MYSIWYDFRIRLQAPSGPWIRPLGGAFPIATRHPPISAAGPNDAQPRLYKPGAVLTVHILAAATGEGHTSELFEAHRSGGLDVRLLWYEYSIHLRCKCMREEIGIKSIVTSFYSFTDKWELRNSAATGHHLKFIDQGCCDRHCRGNDILYNSNVYPPENICQIIEFWLIFTPPQTNTSFL